MSLPSQPTDEELVRRSVAGDTRAYAHLIQKHQRLVFGVALSSIGDASYAEDLAQEAFLEAWRDLSQLRDRARVGSWIAGIARNLGRRWRRSAARSRRREAAAMQGPQDVAPTPLDTALEHETQSLVRDALANVPDAYREVLILYYVHGGSVADVASGLGISEGLVKQRLSRGRRALSSVLETRVERALEQLGSSKGFAATVVAAVGVVTARSAAAGGYAAGAGKVFLAMKALKWTVVGLVLFFVGGMVWFGRASHDTSPSMSAEYVTPARTPARTPASPPSREGVPASTAHELEKPQTREKLLHAIRSTRERRIAASSPASTTTQGQRPSPSLESDDGGSDPDSEYLQETIGELLPMIVDCYTQARANEPTLAGTLVVNFTIEGEPGVGGLVTESAIDQESSDIVDAELGECVQETMFALEIEPPTNGGIVRGTYPFTFRHE